MFPSSSSLFHRDKQSTSALTTFHITPLWHLYKNYSCLAPMKHSRRILQVKIAGQQVRIMQNDPAMVNLYGPWCVVKTHPDVAPFGLNKPWKVLVNTILPADLRSRQGSELWTSRDHREGNEVKGRGGSREWRKGGGREGEREEEGREDAVSALQVGMRRAGWRDTATHQTCEKWFIVQNKGTGTQKCLEI